MRPCLNLALSRAQLNNEVTIFESGLYLPPSQAGGAAGFSGCWQQLSQPGKFDCWHEALAD